MIDSTVRSPSEKTRPTIFCSTSCTSPSSAPSRMIERISSSVTLLSAFFSPSSCEMPAVLCESSHTKGEASRESMPMGRDMKMAIFSAPLMPMRLGTSSPKMSVR